MKQIQNQLIIISTLLCLMHTGNLSASQAQPQAQPKAVTSVELEFYMQFMEAIEKNQEETIIELINAGMNTEHLDHEGNTPLIIAAKKGKIKAVRALIKKKAHIHARNKTGWTALMFAAQYGHDLIINLLLEAGARINDVTDAGSTALMIAASYSESVSTVSLLLEKGAQAHLINRARETALSYAVQPERFKAREQYQIVVQLLKKLNTHQPTGEDGHTPLMLAVKTGGIELVELVLTQRPPINAKDLNGRTALMHAISGGNNTIIELLLTHKADIHLKDNNGNHALIYASELGQEKTVTLLLAAKAQVNSVNNKGQSALFFAVAHRRATVIDILLANSADINIVKTQNGISPAILSLKVGDPDIINKFKPKEIVCSKEMFSTFTQRQKDNAFQCVLGYWNDLTIAEILRQTGVDINCRSAFNTTGNTALLYASGYNKSEIISYLLKLGAKTDLVNSQGESALAWAIASNSLEASEQLIAAGAQTSLRVTNGTSLLGLAIIYGASAELTALLETANKLNALDPILVMHKTRNRNPVAAQWLKQVDINAPHENNETAFATAIRKRMVAGMRFLLSVPQLVLPSQVPHNGSSKLTKLINNKISGLQEVIFDEVSKHNFEAVKRLVKEIQDLGIFNSVGNNLLHIVMNSIKNIDAHGDRLELTPKDYKQFRADKNILFFIISINPDLLYIPNMQGVTPLDIAAQKPHILKMLLTAAFAGQSKLSKTPAASITLSADGNDIAANK